MPGKSFSSSTEQRKCCRRSAYPQRTHEFLAESSVSGVAYIFVNPASSIFRKLFWIFILLISTVALLYVLYDRFNRLIQEPTSTALSFYQDADQVFPAVTVCSNNGIRNSTYTGEDFLFVNNLFHDTEFDCDTNLNSSQRPVGFTDGFQDMIVNGGHGLLDLIVECEFMRKDCSVSEFVTTPTPLGVCYTFNSGRNGSEVFKARATGAHVGLSLTINVERDDYFLALNQDAGVKVSIHPQGVPPRPDEQGISVGIGHKAFIGIRKTITVDESSFRNCSNGDETGSWNFLQEFDYSANACILDCLYTEISNKCGCNEFAEFYTPDVGEYIDRRSCMLNDFCCDGSAYGDPSVRDPQLCDCPLPCTFDTYEKTISYSTFPNDFEAELSDRFPSSYVKSNFLSINVFFETLTVEQRITSDAYTWPALVADVGGQLGLFLGFTALTFVEVLLWIIDLIKDRIIGYRVKGAVESTNPTITEKDIDVGGEMTTFAETKLV